MKIRTLRKMISEDTEKRLEQLNKIFLEENAKLNLSAFRTTKQSLTGNILDSLALLDTKLLPENAEGLHIMDIGTGGGFPLLVLAICLPKCHFTGLDSTEKKILAVQRIIDAMEIPNVTLVVGRAEELGRDENHREIYDLVLARGVAELNTLLEFTSPFAKVHGHIVCWKSLTIEKELEDSLIARTNLSSQLTQKYEYELPEDFGKRQLLIFEKRATLSNKYPRATGIPKKKPLL